MYESRYSNFKKGILCDNRASKLIFKIDGRNHYVYRITDIYKDEHYYGSRVTTLEPKDDIGFKYFSSSSNKEFISQQKRNQTRFKYKIIRIFDNPGDCIIFESYLHQYFQVHINNNFINQSIQSPFGWTSTCNKNIKSKIRKSRMRIDPITGLSIAIIARKKSILTLNNINPETGNKKSVDLAILSAKTMAKIDPNTNKSIRDLATEKSVNTMAKIDPNTNKSIRNIATSKMLNSRNIKDHNGMSINNLHSINMMGKNNPNFKGYYKFQDLEFESAGEMSQYFNRKIHPSTIIKMYKNLDKSVTMSSYKRSKIFKTFGSIERIVGKTYKQLGFTYIYI